MSRSTVSARKAADLITTAEQMRTSVRAAARWRFVSWLSGMAVATVLYFTGLGLAVDDRGVLVVTGVFVACVAGLSIGLLAGARTSPLGLPRRWAWAVGGWGALFGLAMSVGMSSFRGQLLFWVPVAVVAVLPLVLGARAEARA